MCRIDESKCFSANRVDTHPLLGSKLGIYKVCASTLTKVRSTPGQISVWPDSHRFWSPELRSYKYVGILMQWHRRVLANSSSTARAKPREKKKKVRRQAPFQGKSDLHGVKLKDFEASGKDGFPIGRSSCTKVLRKRAEGEVGNAGTGGRC